MSPVALLLLALPLLAEASCRERRTCCPGRDSSCVVALPDKPCYCDHACLAVGDCCPDFADFCGVRDCEVTEWGPWSSCSAECGTGVMTRDRAVRRQPENGGTPCPELRQERTCSGQRCEMRSSDHVYKEAAMILPAAYSTPRVVNASTDIRKNLRLKYPKDPIKETSKEYCVVFEVTKVRKECDSEETLAKGSQVCVRCEKAAWRKHLGYRCNGHGVSGKQTRWVTLPKTGCTGRWVRKEVSDTCPCHASGQPDFIFV